MIVLEIGGYYRNKTADNGFELDVEKVREKEMKLKNKTKQKKSKNKKTTLNKQKKRKQQHQANNMDLAVGEAVILAGGLV